jgi:hypothetical protein
VLPEIELMRGALSPCYWVGMLSENHEAKRFVRAAWEASERLDLHGAENALREALALVPGDPAVQSRLGQVLMKQGRLNEGYPLLERGRAAPMARKAWAPPLPFPRWRGQPVAGKRILVWMEGGYGDQIMCVRFAKRLVEQGAEVTWLCPPPLLRLFRDGAGLNVLPSTESCELSRFDFYCPSSGLPGGFDLQMHTLLGRPYLRRPPAKALGAQIGISTRANPDNPSGVTRSLDGEAEARLLGLPGAISLDPETTGACDFYDTAAVVAGLDLVITVDTSVAHLAGALGAPVWILLPYVSDWRWFDGRDDSPWYACAKLYRQGLDRSWSPVVERVEAALVAGRIGSR